MSNFWIKKYKEDKDAKLKEILRNSVRPINPKYSDNPDNYINYFVKEKVPVKKWRCENGLSVNSCIEEKEFDVVDIDLYCKEIMERNRELLRFCIEEKEIVFMRNNRVIRPDNLVKSIYSCEKKKVENNGL